MFALLILPILISGFISLSLSPKNKLLLHRYDGQLLYLKAAKVGVRYFCVALVLSLFFKEPRVIHLWDEQTITTFDIPIVTWVANFIAESTNLQKATPKIIETSWLLSISFITILFAYTVQSLKRCWVTFENILANKSLRPTNDIARIAILGKYLTDSPIDFMFYESFKRRKPILVTLKSRKVYVGIVNKLAEPNESKEPNQEISLVTAMSGYRDKDTLEVTFKNNYEVTDLNGQPLTATESSIHILRLEQIDSVCWYHMKTFEQVNGNMHKTPEQDRVADCGTCKSKVKAKFGSLYFLKD